MANALNIWNDELQRALAHHIRRHIIQCLRDRNLSFMELLKCVDVSNHGKIGFSARGEPALKEDATTIITTDTGFKRLYKRVDLNYINPVPIDVLKRFREWGQNL